ncbi:MAG: VTT domain-containing protein [Myxococcaceae bacterium]|nr:VTT domain-containing protein [Myxococcaceae bacterium]
MRRRATTVSPRPARLPIGWTRALVLLLLLGGVVLLVSSDEFQAALAWGLAKAEPVIVKHPVRGALLFLVISALSAMLAFFSSAVLVPVAIQAWGKLGCVFLLWLGWILGGACAYGIARFGGRPVVRRLTSSKGLARYEERISRRTPFGLVLLFQLAVPSEIPGYVLGLARYGLRKYLVILALAELPYAVGTAYLGESLLEQRTFLLLGLGALAIFFSAWALHVLRKRLGP